MFALELRGLCKTYANGHIALRGVELTVEKGDFFALLGPNGAGKSTAIGIISSLVNKTSGSVRVHGIDIDDDFPRAKTVLGVVPQEINFSQFETPLEIVANQAGYFGIPPGEAHERAEEKLNTAKLWDKRSQPSRNLSGGMKRRLMIARALVHDPKLLILDEPTAGVDIEIRRSMWRFFETLNADGTTIILTTHYLEEAENLCRNIAIIDNGEIVEHTSMKDLLEQLHAEVFRLDYDGDASALPAQLPVEVLSDHTMEVRLAAGRSLNEIFASLSSHQVIVKSMRNKSNRLEEIFVRMVSNDES
ncbi:MAG: ABC transporter ATP-binding protein [Pseudomonadota bacterium]